MIVGKKTETPSSPLKKEKYTGFKFAYNEIIGSTGTDKLPEKCSKTNFIKIVWDIKGGKHCGHDHNDA